MSAGSSKLLYLAAAALLVVVARRLLPPRSAAAPTNLSPAPSPPDDGRLRFGVRRGRHHRRQRAAAAETATVDYQEAEPQLSPSPPPPPPAVASLSSKSAAAGGAPIQCHVDGSEHGSGCHGGACLLGQCFCRDGRGGEWCELVDSKRQRQRDCAEEAAVAHRAPATDVHRFAQLDVCAFYEPAYGILRVDEKRWRAAQSWEAGLWSEAPRGQTTDRNEHHAAHFNGYSALPARLGRVVELGSGPYTQTQSLLKPESTVTDITLVDPLAAHYQARTRGCTYRDHRLLGRPVRLLTTSAESFTGAADTLVMISVLQSVQDVPRALQAAYNALAPGGILVFSDRVFDARWDSYRSAGRDAQPFWDVGHPCAVKQTVVDHFLAAFEEIHSSRYTQEAPATRPNCGTPSSSCGGGAGGRKRKAKRLAASRRDEQIYFIGRKPPRSA